ncbi:MAG TPA: Fic family protein [Longimicrobiaceae bacterium]|nr:Fic family protein [Longimicrobiaceae bacterium]
MPGRTIALTWAHEPTLYAPAKYRRACRYEAFVPTPLAELSVSLPAEAAGIVSEAESAIHVLNASARPALAPLSRLLLKSESIASSKIEGMQLDPRELARAESRMETGGRVSATALEIVANIDAMEFAVHEAAIAGRFTVEEIRSIHRRLMERSVNPRIAGEIRAEQNWIGGNDHNPCSADFVPPPPEYVAPLLEDLCAAIEDDRLPPLMQAALVHAQFETIHPFHDGNGRAGRALIHVVLRRRGLAPAYVPPISIVLARARDRYIEGLARFRGDEIGAWIEYFAAAAASAAHLAAAYVEAVQVLQEQWRAQVAALAAVPRADSAVWSLIDSLPAHPLITAPVAATVTGRSKPPTYQAIEQLQAAGVLVPRTESKRNRAWEATGLLDLLVGLESGVAPRAASRSPREKAR